MTKKLIVPMVVASAIFILVSRLLAEPQQVGGVLVGVALASANTLLLVWGWGRIFQKKSIAIAALVIVFKYALFGSLIYLVITKRWVDPVGFAIGLGVVIPAMVWFAIRSTDWRN